MVYPEGNPKDWDADKLSSAAWGAIEVRHHERERQAAYAGRLGLVGGLLYDLASWIKAKRLKMILHNSESREDSRF